MKKALFLTMAVILLSGCAQAPKDTENTTEITTESQTEDGGENAEYTQDDFVLYTEEDGQPVPVVWLGMVKDTVDEYTAKYPRIFEGMDNISYNNQPVIEDGKATDETVDYICLVSYTGGSDYLETQKGIKTAGLEDIDNKNSTAEDVISAYGLDSGSEEFYIGSPDDDMYTVALYFDIDNHNNVTRLCPEKGTDISDIANVERADYFLKFIIADGKVTGIQMYRQRPVNA